MKRLLIVIFLFFFLISSLFAARLPVDGSDSGTWGNVLNNYLLQEHDGNGSHVNVTVTGFLNISNSTGDTHFYLDPATGNVGIGETNPTNALSIVGLMEFLGSTSLNTTLANPQIGRQNSGQLSIAAGADALGDIVFYTGGALTERMRIERDGFIGIGTSDPNVSLHVIGNINASGNICDGANNCLNSVSGSGELTDEGTVINLSDFTDDVSLNTFFIDNTNSYTGIGTNSPNKALQVLGDLKVQSDSVGETVYTNMLYWNSSDDSLQLIENFATRSINFYPGSNSVIRGGTAGWFGVQAGSGQYLSLAANQGSGGSGRIDLNANGSSIFFIGSADDLRFRDADGSENLVIIQGDGDVGIGTTAPEGPLHVNGVLSQIYSPTGGTSPFNAGNTFRALRLQNNNNSAGSAVGIDFVTGNASTGTSYIASIKEGNFLGALAFGTRSGGAGNYAEHLRINSDGDIGIGVSNPTNKFEVFEESSGAQGNSTLEFGTSSGHTQLTLQTTSTFRNPYINLYNGGGSTAGWQIGNYQSGDKFTIQRSNLNSLGSNQLGSDFIIDYSGNVGIGNSTPTEKLHVEGGFFASQRSGIGLDPSSNGAIFGVINTNNLYGAAYFKDNTNGSDPVVEIRKSGSSTGPFLFLSENSGAGLTVIDNAGNIGIGTVDPNVSLHVIGDINITGTSYFSDIEFSSENVQLDLDGRGTASIGVPSILMSGGDLNSSSNTFEIDYYKNGSQDYLRFIDGGANTVMSVHNGGNIGIGTVSPNQELVVVGGFNATGTSYFTDIDLISSNARLDLDGRASGSIGVPSIYLRGGDIGGSSNVFEINYYKNGSEDYLRFIDGGANNVLSIHNGGEVGIGTLSPQTIFEINQSSGTMLDMITLANPSISGSAGVGMVFQTHTDQHDHARISATRGTAAAAGELYFETATAAGTLTNRITVDQDGNVGFGTMDPNVTIHVIGDINATGNICDGANNCLNSVSGSFTDQGTLINLSDFTDNVSLNALFIDNTNSRVGLGTNFPLFPLHFNSTRNSVTEDIRFESSGLGGGIVVSLKRPGTGSTSQLVVGNNQDSAAFSIGQDGDGTNHFRIQDVTHTSGNPTVVSTPFTIEDGSGDNLLYLNSNSVGIGLIPSSYPLEVNGSIFLDADNTHIYFGNANTFIGENSNTDKLELRGGSSSTAVIIDTDSQIGVHESNPEYGIEIGYVAGQNYFGVSNVSDGDIFVINENENVGIGTADPNATLHVFDETAGNVTVNGAAGTLVVEGATQSGISVLARDNIHSYFAHGSPSQNLGAGSRWNYDVGLYTFLTDKAGADIAFLTNTQDEVMRLTDTGEVGIGTTDPNSSLHVMGNVTITGTQLDLPQVNSGGPVLSFGEDDGFSANNPGDIRVYLSGIPYWQFSTTHFSSGNTGGGSLIRTGSSFTVPYVYSISDTNTGLGYGGNDMASLIAGGVNVMNIINVSSSVGRVGIGTYDPNVSLHVIGDINASGDVCDGYGNCLNGSSSGLSGSGASNRIPIFDGASSVTSNPGFLYNPANGRMSINTTTASGVLNLGGSKVVIFDGDTGGNMQGVSSIRSGSARAGNLLLDSINVRVGGDVVGARLAVEGRSDSTLVPLAVQVTNDTAGTIQAWYNHTGGNVLYVTSEGGLGKNDNANGVARVAIEHFVQPASADGDGVGINLRTEQSSGGMNDIAYIDSYYTDISADEVDMRFFVREDSENITERMRIDGPTGRVGIGTTSPSVLLDVQGSILANNELRFVDSNTRIYHTNGELNFRVDGSTDLMTINSTGRIGIGTTNPNATLDVIGDINASGEICDGADNCLHTVVGGAGELTDEGSVINLSDFTDDVSFNSLFIDNTNRYVGIGNSDPNVTLHIIDDPSTGTPMLQLSSTIASGGFPYLSFHRPSQNTWDIGMHNYNRAGGNSFSIKDLGDNTYPFAIEDSSPNSSIHIEAGTGSVGFGTSDPNSTIDVIGDVTISSEIIIDQTSSETEPQIKIPDYETGLAIHGNDDFSLVSTGTRGFTQDKSATELDYDLRTTNSFEIFNTTSDIIFDVEEVGNVGIGTGSPQRNLHISDTLRIEPRSSAPSSPSLGDLYVDSDTNSLCFYNSSGWEVIGGAGACS